MKTTVDLGSSNTTWFFRIDRRLKFYLQTCWALPDPEDMAKAPHQMWIIKKG